MICLSVRLVKVSPDISENLIKHLRRGGVLATLAQQLKGHMGTSILEADISTDLYLVIDHWQSPYDFFVGEISPIGIVLDDVLRRMAYDHSTLRPFSFPPPETLAEALDSEAMVDADSAESQADLEDSELVRN